MLDEATVQDALGGDEGFGCIGEVGFLEEWELKKGLPVLLFNNGEGRVLGTVPLGELLEWVCLDMGVGHEALTGRDGWAGSPIEGEEAIGG